ncbi:MAG TPA: HAD-IC family P-type ATPase [Longilinea sp.]|nr:HAD-IC family P-type ATPase [Longilinea sp.]
MTPQTGLTFEEVAALKKQGLVNHAPLKTSRTYAQIFKENLFTFINMVLFGLGLALVLLGRPTDAFVSVAVIFANTIVSLVQEIRAKRMLDQIALLTRPTATVIRAGEEQVIDPNEIVLGDLLLVHPGDQIVVDGMVSSDCYMDVDESLLTGEADTIPKKTGDTVYSGSFCVHGNGCYVAQKIGADSLANQITQEARAYRHVQTPLQQQINLVVKVLLVIAGYFIVILGISTVVNHITLVRAVMNSVVIIGLVPNGLFLAIAVAYALGAIRIAGKGALIQETNAIESLSNVDVLCLDKTGTLTTNHLRFHAMLPLVASEDKLRTALGIFAASDSAPNRTIKALRESFPDEPQPVFAEMPFSSEHKWSGFVFKNPQHTATYILGAPEVFEHVAGLPASAHDQINRWEENGLRVLLLAGSTSVLRLQDRNQHPRLPAGLQALGLVAFSDELRPEARATLESFQKAKVKVKIISGDSPQTVAAVARQAGMPKEIKSLSGRDLEGMDEAQFKNAVEETTIFGRISPRQKEKIVSCLRSQGHYVAMIGDGVNDVLSLKQANVGIAMQSGSQATRSVADVVLMEDTFAPLSYAVIEGQRITNGMQAILKLFMTRIVYSALLIISLDAVNGFPFAPRNNSVLTLFTVGVPSLALAAWASPGALPIATMVRRMFRFVLPAAFTITLAGLAIFVVYFVRNYPGNFTALSMAQTALTNFCTLSGIVLVAFVDPPFKWLAGSEYIRGDKRPALLSIALLIAYTLILTHPTLRRLFDLATLSWVEHLVIAGAVILWALVLRAIWKSRLVERFFDIYPKEE